MVAKLPTWSVTFSALFGSNGFGNSCVRSGGKMSSGAEEEQTTWRDRGGQPGASELATDRLNGKMVPAVRGGVLNGLRLVVTGWPQVLAPAAPAP
jgi:hypothetical protein